MGSVKSLENVQALQASTVSQCHVSNTPDHMQGLSASAVFQRIPQARWARPALGALGLLLAGSLLLSMVRVVGRFNSPKAKRRRTVDLNKVPKPGF